MQSSYLRTIWLVMPGVLKIQIKYSNMSWQLWSQLRNGQQYQAIQPNSRQKAPFNLVFVMVIGLWIKNQLKHIKQCYKLQYSVGKSNSSLQMTAFYYFALLLFISVIIFSFHWLLSNWLHFIAAMPLMYFWTDHSLVCLCK